MENYNEIEVNEPALKYGYISPDEYLAMERSVPRKHEYYNGRIVAMAGATNDHIEINSTLFGEIYIFLKGKNCRPLLSDLKVVSPGRESYTYPDLTIACKDPMMEDLQLDSMINPSVIVEILSKSTEKYDLEEKFFFYKKISCLKEYILIDSRRRFARILRKQTDGDWKTEDIQDENGEITIQLIGLKLSFDTIYQNTEL
jgi:Uma2 family endonuclease